VERLVLVVDDDESVAAAVERALRRAGHRVLVAHRGADALQLARENPPDVLVLDIWMPGMSGIEVCRHIRANPQLARIPVLFLTARDELGDKIEGFEAGADDYLTKPFDLRELTLRVQALLRRAQRSEVQTDARVIEVGPLSLDSRTFRITTPLASAELTPVEFELLRFLMANAGRVYSAEQLLEQVWGYPPGSGLPDLVRVHIKNIRGKIEPDAGKPIYLRNVPRRGYVIDVPTE